MCHVSVFNEQVSAFWKGKATHMQQEQIQETVTVRPQNTNYRQTDRQKDTGLEVKDSNLDLSLV